MLKVIAHRIALNYNSTTEKAINYLFRYQAKQPIPKTINYAEEVLTLKLKERLELHRALKPIN